MDGKPILKPWTVATNDQCLYETLETSKCPGSDVHPEHRSCEGKDTKLTESYTPEMAKIIHGAWEQSCANKVAGSGLNDPASVESPTKSEGNPEAIPAMPLVDVPQGHRQKLTESSLPCNAMVATARFQKGDQPGAQSPGCLEKGMGPFKSFRNLG